MRPGSLLRDQVKLVGANVLDPEPVRRFIEILAESSDRVDVGLLCRRREVANHHVVDHSPMQRAHRGHPGAPVLRVVDVTIHIFSDRGLRLSRPASIPASGFVQSARKLAARTVPGLSNNPLVRDAARCRKMCQLLQACGLRFNRSGIRFSAYNSRGPRKIPGCCRMP